MTRKVKIRIKEGLVVFSIVAVLMVTIIPALIWGPIKVTSTTDPYSGVLVVHTGLGQGSCFVVANQNDWYYAITANHVVQAFGFSFGRFDFPSSVMVDDEQYEAEVVRMSSQDDLALIRFKSPENYRIYSLASAKVGEVCITVGWTFGSKVFYRGYVITTDFNGSIASNGGGFPGVSGGPLLNQDNEVIGITVGAPVYNCVYDSTALSVPSRFAKALIVTIE